MKKLIAMLLALCLVLGMAACGASNTPDPTKAPDAPKVEDTKKDEVKVEENLTATQKIIKEAETMTLEELAK